MEHQNLGRQQRSKGANMKQAFLVMMFVAGCAWLIYQINHPRHKPDSYGGPEQLYRAVSLGRKGSPSWLYEIQFPTLGNVHIGKPKNDKNSGNTDENPNIEAINNDSQSNEKEEEAQIRMSTESEGSIAEESKTLTGGVWVHIFDDENGVPPEVNETERIGGVAQIDIMHDENISSNYSKQNGAVKSNILEVTSSENDIVEVTFGGSTSSAVDADVNSQSIIVHADT